MIFKIFTKGPPSYATQNTSASLFWTAALWLEEPRVHDKREELVYLPPQYGPTLLVDIRRGQFGDWLRLAELGFESKLSTLAGHWNSHFRYVLREIDLP